jgi:uncharacterized membrane protein SpoIIM required for sporulation
VLVTLITIGILPIISKLLRHEEKMDEKCMKALYKQSFFNRHRPIIEDFFAFFMGVAVATSVAFIFLPEPIATSLLHEQIIELQAIRGAVTTPGLFEIIVLNNLKIMVFCFLLSFFYATGAMIILIWNATILGLVVGQMAKQSLGLVGIPIIMAGFMPHGIFEFLAYFAAAIAGGILSIAISRHKVGTPEFDFVFRDALKMMLFAILVVFIGGVIEVGL